MTFSLIIAEVAVANLIRNSLSDDPPDDSLSDDPPDDSLSDDPPDDSLSDDHVTLMSLLDI